MTDLWLTVEESEAAGHGHMMLGCVHSTSLPLQHHASVTIWHVQLLHTVRLFPCATIRLSHSGVRSCLAAVMVELHLAGRCTLWYVEGGMKKTLPSTRQDLTAVQAQCSAAVSPRGRLGCEMDDIFRTASHECCGVNSGP